MADLIWRVAKWVFFRLDAESVHHFTLGLIRLGSRFRGAPLRIVSGGNRSRHALLSRPMPVVFGLRFASRLGLAAGFDKNAELVASLPVLSFGFVEIGTVTPRPQPGNDRPRLFRDPSRQALFNRMGFNSLGAAVASANLRAARESGLPEGFRVGVNIGKNKETSLEDAPRDYAQAARAFEGLADYLVINVSSPNTPGLRSLQTVEALKPIVDEVRAVVSGWDASRSRPPILLKLAPEIRGKDLSELIVAMDRHGIDGWVLTNTLAGDWVQGGQRMPGGWSGGPLTVESSGRLEEARAATRLPIISVGGIMSAEEAASRLRMGADLIQIYSGWIFNGPAFPRKIIDFLAKNGL